MIAKFREIHARLFPTRHAELREPSDSDLVIGAYFDERLKKAEEEIRLLKWKFLQP